MTSRLRLFSEIASSAIVACIASSPANAQQLYNFDIPAQDLGGALRAFARTSGLQVIFNGDAIRGKRSVSYHQRSASDAALQTLLQGTGMSYRRDGNMYVVGPAGKAAAATGPAEPPVQETASQDAQPQAAPDQSSDIIVTAQKRRESIQSVPIAVSAFTSKSLDELKIEGGSELLRAVPNVTFSKTNFASYNFSIRGIGTKALSVTSDPAVAVSFNNTPLLRNRLFEQEYFDVERVEVLRGPQGTLYGRNATAGVVNMIPIFASPDAFAGSLKLEGGNYGSMRANGMLNVPLTDTLAVRAAGAWTTRSGYDYNTVTNRDVNGRNLWSTRATASWEPSSRFKVTAAWEHFNEKDDRSRTGKQLCNADAGPSSVGTATIPDALTRGELSQGCGDGSLYTDNAYGVPNGFSLPYVIAGSGVVTLGTTLNGNAIGSYVGLTSSTVDPYAGVTQSRDLHEIATAFDPTFRAKNDVFQLNAEFAVTPSLTFYSQTAYTKDYYLSTQDYNRFNSNPAFNDSVGLYDASLRPLPSDGISAGGILNDPQLGRSDRILGLDMVKSHSEQWYQEFRLQSSFSGPINFSLGVNYLHFKIDEDYYVFNNVFTAIAQGAFNNGNFGGVVDPCTGPATDLCVYVDPNPLSSINGQGHNYFRSRNLATTESLAGFGELYWKATSNLKFTIGLRYTDDKKTATPFPSQLLLGPSVAAAGYVNKGYPASPDIVQRWGRLTGRFVVDWKPDIGFTDDTLVYASYARGYKGGGANPPGIGANPASLQFFPQPTTFKPESVNAFEIGMKNTFAGGMLTLNADAFFSSYKDYQVSQIVDRSALNENFDADVWGAELEATFRPTPRIRLNGNFGYLGTRIADGMTSIDVMNRTQDDPDWTLVKPFIQLASNCIAPTSAVEQILNSPFYGGNIIYLETLCGASLFGGYTPGSLFSLLTGVVYDPATAPNQGRGISADLGGKELPNAPHWTVNLGAQYTLPIGDWGLTLRGDYYRQGKSWARVYNDAIDRLKSWDNTNLTLTLERPKDGLAVQFYVKNVFNKTPITDAFLNSDDSGLTANVFTLDPRIFALSISKTF